MPDVPFTRATLNLRVNEEVEVKSREEILRTLDADGSFEVLPFMPEMLEFCGRRFRVAKSAHKTCDTIDYKGLRRMENAVHLEGLRCSGAAHGGCQARCVFFWKEAWLRRVDGSGDSRERGAEVPAAAPAIDEAGLAARTQTANGVYRCQATEMNRATTVLSGWQHVPMDARDVRSGNVRIRDVIRWLTFEVFTVLVHIKGYRALMWLYNRIARWLGGFDYPVFRGKLEKTPLERLDLQPGEWVRVKDRNAIVETLDAKNLNRGLSFDVEMVNFCGRSARVLARIERIIDEKTGCMLHFKTPTVILEGITCQAYYKNKGCPRSIYPYWREIWLERTQR